MLFTSRPSVTAFTVTFAFASTFCASSPHGTCGWHSATFTPAFPRSAMVVMALALAGATAISAVFVAKVTGVRGVTGRGHLGHVLRTGRGEHVRGGPSDDLLGQGSSSPRS